MNELIATRMQRLQIFMAKGRQFIVQIWHWNVFFFVPWNGINAIIVDMHQVCCKRAQADDSQLQAEWNKMTANDKSQRRPFLKLRLLCPHPSSNDSNSSMISHFIHAITTDIFFFFSLPFRSCLAQCLLFSIVHWKCLFYNGACYRWFIVVVD